MNNSDRPIRPAAEIYKRFGPSTFASLENTGNAKGSSRNNIVN